MKKFKFKLRQKVAFSPADGNLRFAVIHSCRTYVKVTKMGGKDKVISAAYIVAESDGTLWDCEEEELVEVQRI